MPQTDQYPPLVGMIFVFNIIVGTGALTLPAAFAAAGWFFSTVILLILAFVSFITFTFVVESMACANATIQWRRILSHKIDESEVPADTESEEEEISTEETAILRANRSRRYFSLDMKVELGQIAGLYLNKTGHILFFIALCIYLFGDLSIYTAATGKTMVDLVCNSVNNSENYEEKCWVNSNSRRIDTYRIFIVIFAGLIGPFAFFNVQKTKYLQYFTVCLRWTAFAVMVSLAVARLVKFGAQGHPSAVDLKEIPVMAGSSIYSFMCHHSLPGLIAPFSSKAGLNKKISFDFVLISSFYLLLCLTGSFAFESLDVLYSLNFIRKDDSTLSRRLLGYFLGAFPLFPMFTSFPIIAITLQSNLKQLFLGSSSEAINGFFLDRLVFPTVAVIPPIVLALSTHNLKWLVEITGSYAGVIVQYIIPAVLVFYARRQCIEDFGSCNQRFSSPFKHFGWFLFVIIWAGLCVIFVTVDLVIN